MAQRMQKPRHSLPEVCPEINGKRVLVASHGSRGDVQPFAAVALGLKAAGFDVMVFANPEQEKLVTDLGVKFSQNGFDFKTFFTNDACQKAFAANNFLKFLDALGEFNAKFSGNQYELYYKCIEDFKPALIVCGTSHWPDIAWIPTLFRIPSIAVNLSNSHTIDPYKAPFGLPTLPFGMNRPLWNIVIKEWQKGLKNGYGSVLARLSGKPVDEFFPTADDIAQVFGGGPKFGFAPYVIAQDDNMVGRKPIDAPHLVYSGSFSLPPDECKGKEFGGDQTEALNVFMQQCGENPPVYIGWGSLKGTDANWLSRFAVKSLKCAGCKGIILEGWAGLKEELLVGDKDETELLEYSRKNILWLKTAAHEILFPQCSVIVHHGGIGTTQVGLRSGRPSIITPLFYDQFDSSEIVEAQKVGFATKQLLKTKPEDLADCIRKCMTDSGIQKNAANLADKLNSRNGIKDFAQLTIKFLKEEVDTGKYWQNWDKLMVEKRGKSQQSSLPLQVIIPLAILLAAGIVWRLL